MKEEDINAFFKDKEKQLELINKFQPGFLKFETVNLRLIEL